MARRALLAALQPYGRRSQRAVDPLRATDTDRSSISVAQKRVGHPPHSPSTGASRRCPHSDRLSRLLLAGNPEAAPVAARSRVDAHGSAGKTGRNPNDRRLDSDGRSTLVNSAALHATLRRHQAAHRETETGVAQPAVTAPHWARRSQRNGGAIGPVGGPFVVETFQ